jgi:3-isopropylmalate dehydrogenase
MFERSFNLVEEAQLIKKIVFESIEEKIVTGDLSGKGKSFTTSQIGDWIKERIEKG